MKKHCLILIILCSIWLPIYAQRKMQQLDEDEAKKQEQVKAYEKGKKGFDPSKLTYGGNIGMAFSNGGSFILAQPMVGYKVLPKTILGLGLTYIYQSYNQSGIKYSSTAYGPIVFARQIIVPQIFLHAEYQPINYERYYTLTYKERVWSNQLFVGGGLGSNGAQVYILYDLLHDRNSYYQASPWYIRIGFMF